MVMTGLSNFKSTAKDKKFHSGLEETVAADLKARGVPVRHEDETIAYAVPQKASMWTPQFVLSNGLIVQTVGFFRPEHRKRLLIVKMQHPALDIRLIFQNSRRRINKQSKVSYGDWCGRYGVTYSDQSIPAAWLRETLPLETVAAVKALKPKRTPGRK